MGSGRKQQAPAIQFYWRDYMASGRVQRMSWQERAVYLHLLFRMYEAGGWLSSDPDDIADALGCAVEEVETLVTPTVMKCFVESDGRIANERVLRELEQRDEFFGAKAEAGKKGAAKRWGNGGSEKPDGKPMANDGTPMHLPSACHESRMANDSSLPNSSPPVPTQLDSTQGESEGGEPPPEPEAPPEPEGSSVPSSPERATNPELGPPKATASPPPKLKRQKAGKDRKPPRRKWRIVTREGVPDIEGVDEDDRAKDVELGPDVDADGLRRKFAAWYVERLAEGQKVPKDLRRSFYKLAQPHLNDEGGWLVREQASAAQGRSRFPKEGLVSAGAAEADPLAMHRLEVPRRGSWPIDKRGWDEERDGEWFSLFQALNRGEHFYVPMDGWIRPQSDGGIEGQRLRKATLDEIFTFFAEGHRDPSTAQGWLLELELSSERGQEYAQRVRRAKRGRRSREIAQATRGGSPSSLGAILGAPPPDPSEDRPSGATVEPGSQRTGPALLRRVTG